LQGDIDTLFDEWVAKHSKSYPTEKEKLLRKDIFALSVVYVNKFYEEGWHNHESGLNEFSDLTWEEFRSTRVNKELSKGKRHVEKVFNKRKLY